MRSIYHLPGGLALMTAFRLISRISSRDKVADILKVKRWVGGIFFE